MAEKLKPCPLCGSTDLKHYVTNARERNRGVIVCRALAAVGVGGES